MTNLAHMRDLGAQLSVKMVLTPRVIDGGTTTEDGVEVSSTAIDRLADTQHPYQSMVVAVPYSFTAIATNTGSITSNVQHSDNSSAGWEDFDDKDGSTANSVTLGSTASTAAQTTDSVLKYDVDLSSAKRYVRVQVTPSLSGTSTETDDLDIAGVVVLGGGNVMP